MQIGRTRRSTTRVALACVLTVVVVLAGASSAWADQARYVFLMIGDGMGTAQRSAAELYINADAIPGEAPEATKRLAMNAMPVAGMTLTYSSSSAITDSAAAATALACGHKMRNGVISVNADATERFMSVAEAVRDAGLKVGIITSVSIDHATPACFYAHSESRGNYYEIAQQLGTSGFDFFGGAAADGKPKDAPRDWTGPSAIDTARANGYTIVNSQADLDGVKGGKVWAFNVSDGEVALPYAIDKVAGFMSLADWTAGAIALLDNPKGFFIMVEGGKIDWACHANDAATSVFETLAFDEAVAQAVAFYKTHPDDTLVVVTADHETGGMTLGWSGGGRLNPKRLTAQTMSHSRFGSLVSRWRDQKATFEAALPTIKDAFGFDGLSDRQTQRLQAAFDASTSGKKARKGSEAYALYGSHDPLTITCLRLVSEASGIGFASTSHTGVPVPTTAIGTGSPLFGGCYDNTAVPKKIMQAMELAQPAAVSATRPSGALRDRVPAGR